MYSPQITCVLTTDRNKLIISDNGIGMDENILAKYFTKIGASFYSSSEFESKNYNFTPLSELGIGVLSCFMLANKVTVETQMEGSKPLFVEIESLTDYLVVRPGKRNSSGTTITLFLKEDVKKEIKLHDTVEHYARHVRIPIRVEEDNRNYLVMDKGYSTADLSKKLENENGAKDIVFHKIKIDDEYVEGVILLKGKKDPLLGWRPLNKSASHYTRDDSPQFILCYEGIFVTNKILKPAWLDNDHILADLNIKKRGVDLTIGRSNIIENEKIFDLTARIGKILIEEMDAFLSNLERRWTNSNELHKIMEDFGSYYITWYINEDNEKYYEFEEFLEWFKKFARCNAFVKGKLRLMKCSDIENSKKKVAVLHSFPFDDDYAHHYYSRCTTLNKDTIYVLSSWFDHKTAKLFSEYDWMHFMDLAGYQRVKGLRGLLAVNTV